MSKEKILSLDFGKRHVGIATCALETGVVFPKGVLRNYGSLDNLSTMIRNLCQENMITRVIVGLPLAEDGSDTRQSLVVKKFGKILENILEKIPVEYIDESFSSHEAMQILRDLGVKGRQMKNTEDELAAAQILFKWLQLKKTV